MHAEILDGSDDFLPFREPILEAPAVRGEHSRAVGFPQLRRVVDVAQKALGACFHILL